MRRVAYTMAELMIVLVIMVMLVAAALPIAKKVLDDSHVREASRQLNAYFAMAKSRAVQTGRPCGVYLKCGEPPNYTPLGIDNSREFAQPFPWPVRHVTELHLAEVPAPYSGSLLDSVGKVQGGFFVPWNVSANQPDTNEITMLAALLSPGETFTVRFDYKGEWHRGQYDATGASPFVFKVPPGSAVVPPSQRPVPFQVRRGPRIVGNAMGMPTGTCIDLTYSGEGPAAHGYKYPNGFQPPLAGMMVMFTPGGGVDEIYFDSPTTKGVPGQPINTLYFLIGKVDKAMPDPLAASFSDIRDSNLADPTSLWVTVGRGNGQVTTSENTPDPTAGTGTGMTPIARLQSYLRAARSVATSREQMKGR